MTSSLSFSLSLYLSPCSLLTALPHCSLLSVYRSEVENFWTLTHLVVTLPSGIQLTQFPCRFRSLLFTLGHRCILFLKSMNLHGLSMVKYITTHSRIYIYIYIWTNGIKQLRIYPFCHLFFYCYQLVLTSGHYQRTFKKGLMSLYICLLNGNYFHCVYLKDMVHLKIVLFSKYIKLIVMVLAWEGIHPHVPLIMFRVFQHHTPSQGWPS